MSFASERRGYDRSAVDAFVIETDRRLRDLAGEVARLQADNAGLRAELAQANEAGGPTVRLSDQAAEVLRVARAQASELTQQARQDADRVVEAAQCEAERLRADAATGLAAVTENRSADLEDLVRRGQADLLSGSEQARREHAQLLAAAELEAGAAAGCGRAGDPGDARNG